MYILLNDIAFLMSTIQWGQLFKRGKIMTNILSFIAYKLQLEVPDVFKYHLQISLRLKYLKNLYYKIIYFCNNSSTWPVPSLLFSAQAKFFLVCIVICDSS